MIKDLRGPVIVSTGGQVLSEEVTFETLLMVGGILLKEILVDSKCLQMLPVLSY